MIEIDECHRELIAAVVRCHKPTDILELGYGSGKTTLAILEAIRRNNKGKLTVVDNFFDWCGNRPAHFENSGFELVVSSEKDFVEVSGDNLWDCIIADADHTGTHSRAWKLIQMLRPRGFIFFHDVTNPMFPMLNTIVQSLDGLLLKDVSTPDEQCWRGLFVYQKP